MPPAGGLMMAVALLSIMVIAGAVWFTGTTPPGPLPAAAEQLPAATPPGGVALKNVRDSGVPAGQGGATSRSIDARPITTPLAAPAPVAKSGAAASAERAKDDAPRNSGAPSPAGRRTFTSPGAAWEESEPVAVLAQGEAGHLQDSPAPPINRELLVQAMASGALRSAVAEEVTETGDSVLTQESALLAATKMEGDPNTSNVEARNAMDRLIGAFSTEVNSETKQDYLALGEELASNSRETLHRLLTLALQPGQPLEVQKQALYLALDKDPAMVRQVAADPRHPLHLEAEAFILQKQIAAGAATSITDTVPSREE